MREEPEVYTYYEHIFFSYTKPSKTLLKSILRNGAQNEVSSLFMLLEKTEASFPELWKNSHFPESICDST